MAVYRLTNRAELEVAAIYEYSIETFGLKVARDNLDGLYERFERLAENPGWGADFGHIDAGLRRYPHRSHSIYYRPMADGVLILRVLHARQDPARHF